MLGLPSRQGSVIEERGPNWFRPARPRPHPGVLSDFARLRALRHNLISVFVESDYTSGNDEGRLLNRQVVLFNQPEAIKHVLVTNNANFERKSPQMRRALEHLVGDGLFISDGETWARRRPLVADIVHRNRMPAFGPCMEAAVAQMVTRWQARAPDIIFDVLQEMAELAADTVSRSVFGQALDPGAARQVVTGFAEYQRLIDSVNLGYYLGADEGWPVIRGPRLRRSVKRIREVIDAVISAHLRSGPTDSSMIDLLIRRQERNPELGLDIAALRSEAATLFMAGHETTATTLSWAWYLLANAPWVEEAVHHEIGSVVGCRAPLVSDVPSLKWCRAVIEETLRLYPPVPILPRQAKSADEVAGISIEPAALVVIVPWLLHRAVDLWDRPHDFLPERFLANERPQPYTYIPFSTGPRVCPGLNFGLTEAVLCLASLAQRFRVRVAPGYQVEPHCRLSLRPRGGLSVRIEARA